MHQTITVITQEAVHNSDRPDTLPQALKNVFEILFQISLAMCHPVLSTKYTPIPLAVLRNTLKVILFKIILKTARSKVAISARIVHNTSVPQRILRDDDSIPAYIMSPCTLSDPLVSVLYVYAFTDYRSYRVFFPSLYKNELTAFATKKLAPSCLYSVTPYLSIVFDVGITCLPVVFTCAFSASK